jgi:hypothetical protein
LIIAPHRKHGRSADRALQESCDNDLIRTSLFTGHKTAATLGIAGTTTKTHLEHIFMKTGVTR